MGRNYSTRLTGFVLAAIGAISLLPATAGALTTDPAGGGSLQHTIQPSLGINYLVRTEGFYDQLGDVMMFAGNFAPGGWEFAHGQLLPIGSNTALFSVVGTTYGGDGRTTFGLPDLRGRTPIGEGHGPGLANRPLGVRVGADQPPLTTAHLAPHSHALPSSVLSTGTTGSGVAYTNMQPSLSLNCAIATTGVYPSQGGGGHVGDESLLGQMKLTARAYEAPGWTFLAGQTLSATANPALYSIVGDTYGGTPGSTFALPDPRGRGGVGFGTGPGLSAYTLGEKTGTESVSLTTSKLPLHHHAYGPSNDTHPTGANPPQPQANIQPVQGLNYIIALDGRFPDPNNPADGGPLLGEISLFAGDFAPGGWALAQGQLLAIAQNQFLYALLGATYGGDGETTFGLPDLRGRLAVGAGDAPGLARWYLGEEWGTETTTLSTSQMPTHNHTISPHLGDANCDGFVDMQDFGVLKDNYSQTGKTWYHADFNGDGVIDLQDFGALKDHFAHTPGDPAAAIPEPTTLALLALAATAFVRRRRR